MAAFPLRSISGPDGEVDIAYNVDTTALLSVEIGSQGEGASTTSRA